MKDAEQPLSGGLISGRVVRIGDTVRREAGPWSATQHALLRHLADTGFPAPRPLGFDAKGREILSWLPGRCSNWPWPAALIDTAGAAKVGAFVSRYHRAVQGFVPPEPAIWRHGAEAPAHGEIVLHGDFAPHNLVWDGDSPGGLIDFELARPGQPLEDAGFCLVRAACLRDDSKTLLMGFDRPPDRRARLYAFAEGYGAPAAELLAAAQQSELAEAERIQRLGGAGLEPWASFLRAGLLDEVAAEIRWLEANRATLI